MKMKRREITTGFVEEIENVSKSLSFITLSPVADEGWNRKRVPVYMELKHTAVNQVVSIISWREGLFFGRFKQSVERANGSESTEMPYSLVREINEAYRQLEQTR